MPEKIKNWLFKNQSPAQTIVKNAAWLFTGQMMSRILRAIIIIYAARVLGAEGWGAFSYAIALATFLTIFADFGINAWLTKEVARDKENQDTYFSTAFFIKLVLVGSLITLVTLFGKYLTNIEEVKTLITIVIFVFAFDSLRDFGASLMRAYEKMEIEAWLMVFTNAAITIFGFIFLAFAPSPQSLAFAYVAGSGIGLIVTIYALKKYIKNLIRAFRGSLVKKIISTAWPFGLMGLLGAIMLNTDIIVIGFLENSSEVGFYSAGQKPVQLLYVLPALIATALFPRLSQLARESGDKKEEFRSTLEKSLAVSFLLSLPLAAGALLVGDQLMIALFGQAYGPSMLVFQILALTFPIVFPSTILGNALFAYGKQRQFIKYVTIGALSNLAANLALIPSFGIRGAAAATIISQLFSNSLFWIKMKGVVSFRVIHLLKKIGIATILMAVVTFFLKFANTHVFSNIFVSAAVYGTTLYVLREKRFLDLAKVFKTN